MCSCLPYLGTESNREQVLNKCLLEEWGKNGLRSLCSDVNTNRNVVSRKSIKSHSAQTFHTFHQVQNMFHLVFIILTLFWPLNYMLATLC